MVDISKLPVYIPTYTWGSTLLAPQRLPQAAGEAPGPPAAGRGISRVIRVNHVRGRERGGGLVGQLGVEGEDDGG